MKDKNKKVKRIAQQIVELEKKCQIDTDNREKYMLKIEQLTGNLSLEELFAIDEYILNNNLLKR